MIAVVLFKVIASTYLQCGTKLLKEVVFCKRCLQKSDIDMFPSLQDFVASTSFGTKELVCSDRHIFTFDIIVYFVRLFTFFLFV